jgi:RimJ/RimL family protein N-acetyltransferase
MTIQGTRIRLRAIERSDIPTFVRWLNDPEVVADLLLYQPISLAQEERWFEDYLKDTDRHIFGIETANGHLIGNVALEDINWKDRSAELGIVIGEKDHWGQGYGTDAVRTLLRFAFQEMNLHRVSLRVFDDNARAIRCYETCGFRHEGRLRQAEFSKGRYRDELMMGILSSEFSVAEGGES